MCASLDTMARLQPHRLELRAVVQRLVLLGRERVFRLARELAPPCRLLVRLGLVIGAYQMRPKHVKFLIEILPFIVASNLWLRRVDIGLFVWRM